MGADGSGAGRRTRSVPPALRRALDARDRECRFPGCGLRFTDAHHIVHWADGGETTLKGLVLLCHRHHRLVHEDGYRVFSDADGQVVFFSPMGKPIAASPPMPPLAADPVDELIHRNRECGVAPDWRSGMPEYRRDRDVPWEMEASAGEALENSPAGDPTSLDAAS